MARATPDIPFEDIQTEVFDRLKTDIEDGTLGVSVHGDPPEDEDPPWVFLGEQNYRGADTKGVYGWVGGQQVRVFSDARSMTEASDIMAAAVESLSGFDVAGWVVAEKEARELSIRASTIRELGLKGYEAVYWPQWKLLPA